MLSKQDVSNLSGGSHLWRFATQLSEQGYAHKTKVRYIAVAKRFLAYLHQCNVAVEVAKPADIESYLQKELRRFRRVANVYLPHSTLGITNARRPFASCCARSRGNGHPWFRQPRR